ncbi:MAG: LysM peptidoglycan-binding domain-containing protein [Intestinimonas sp.]|jgi:spore germination protein|nr:LysM peptidoglycan-binding domain-containing protein [Intestinimonas sp.]
MEIYIVQPGDSIDSIARAAGLPVSQILADNQPPNPSDLVPGQALVLRFPQTVHTVQPGDTLDSVARAYGVTVRQLYRNNLTLGGEPTVWPGQTLVIAYEQVPGREITVNGYAYPFINRALLRATLPFLTWMAPFSYGIRPDGSLVEPEDEDLISMAKQAGTAPLMHLSTLTDEGNFSNTLASRVLNEPGFQQTVIANVLKTIQEKGYDGLDVDFEFVFPQDAAAYAAFLTNLNSQLTPMGLPLAAALAPKISADQKGLLYEGHDYRAVGAAADFILLMTYEWGYTYRRIGYRLSNPPLPNRQWGVSVLLWGK